MKNSSFTRMPCLTQDCVNFESVRFIDIDLFFCDFSVIIPKGVEDISSTP